jgi:hypothetical protein
MGRRSAPEVRTAAVRARREPSRTTSLSARGGAGVQEVRSVAGIDASTAADAVREWDRDYGNQVPAPGLRMAPAANRDLLTARNPRFIIGKPASRLVTDWRR